MVMVVTATARMFVFMVMAAAARMVVIVAALAMMFLVVVMRMPLLPGQEGHFRFHRPGNGLKGFHQRVRILRRQPKLPGGKGDYRLLNLRMGVQLFLNFRAAIRAVQILNDVQILFHKDPSLYSHMSIYSYVQNTKQISLCQ